MRYSFVELVIAAIKSLSVMPLRRELGARLATARALLMAIFAWSASLVAAGGALAQSGDPGQPDIPVFSAVDERGVDLISGRFQSGLESIAIGNPGAGGMSYSILLYGYGERRSFEGIIQQSGATYSVNIGGAVDVFTKSGSNFTSNLGLGSTLSYNSSTRIYTYVSNQGSTALFNEQIAEHNSGVHAFITRLTHPNGERLDYTYNRFMLLVWNQQMQEWVFEPRAARLTRVDSNTGYRATLSYASNANHPDWWRITEIALRNMAAAPASTDHEQVLSIGAPSATERTYTRSGNTTRVTRDLAGGELRIRMPGSTSDDVVVQKDTSVRVTSVAVGAMTWTYAYVDSGGQRTTTVTAPDDTTRVVVSSLSTGQVVSDTNEVGQTTEFEHDSNGRLTRVTYPEGNAVEYSYDARGNVTEVRRKAKPDTGLADIVTSATYPSACTNPVTCNRALTTTDANGQVTDYTYDATHGGVLTVTAPAAEASGDRAQTRYTYASMTAWYYVGTTLTEASTPVFRVTQVSACASGTSPGCVGTANETRTTISYGSAGVANNRLPVSITRASGTGAISATTVIAYNNRGDVISVDGPLSGATDTVYYHYDELRRQVGMIGPDPDGGGPLHRRASRVMFNTAGVVTAAEGGTVTGTSLSALNAMTVLERVETDYDTLFRPIRQRVKDGSATIALQQVSYDSMGRPHCVALRMNPAAFGSPPGACTQSTAGSHGPDRITRYTYDAAGRVTVVRGGHGTVDAGPDLRIVYTANGQRANVRDRAGNRTTFVYDGHDRLYRQRYPHPTSTGTSSNTDYDQYLYDGAGRISEIRRRSGHTITPVYDLLGRVVERTTPSGQPDVSYTYDLFGRTTLISQSVGHALSFTYDALNRQLTESGPQGTISYQYNAAGQRTRMTWPDGFYVTYDYDNTGAVTHIRENGASSGAGVLATYAYDALGRMASLTRGNGVVTTASFDAASRLTELAHDPAGISWDQTVSFTYNAAGQIASRTMANDIYAFTGYTNIDVNFTVNGLNQYLSGPPSAPAYDARGNLTADGYGATGSYDYDNRLTSWTPAGGPATALTYDPAGRLYQLQPTGGAGTRFLYDGPNLVGEYSTTNVLLRRYVQGPGMDAPLVRYDGTGTSNKRWLLADERGSIIAETNGSGGVSQINTYDDYGVPASGNVGRFGYTGQLWLGEIGLYSYKNRIYHPGLARFLQPDPIGLAGGLNLYAYVGGDPINFTDPWGLWRWDGGDSPPDVVIIRGTRTCPSGAVCISGDALQDLLDMLSRINLNDLGNIDENILRGIAAALETICQQIGNAENLAGRALPNLVTININFSAVVGGGFSSGSGLWMDRSTGQWGSISTGGFGGGLEVSAGALIGFYGTTPDRLPGFGLDLNAGALFVSGSISAVGRGPQGERAEFVGGAAGGGLSRLSVGASMMMTYTSTATATSQLTCDE